MAKYTETDRAEAVANLARVCPKGARVFFIVRKVSASGMSRRMDFYTMDGDRMQWLSGWFAVLLGMNRPENREGLRIGGCGMDMGWHTITNAAARVHGSDAAWKSEQL